MRSIAVAPLLPLALAMAVPARAHHRPYPPPSQAGALVALTVEVEGAATPLHAASDGSGRHYVEARPGARYALRLANRTGERLAVLMTVDGLNVISGERQAVSQRGRMYVLDPSESALVQGWRSSLDDVHRFTFVDERASYATRSGRANARMGWIELAVYRERLPHRRPAPDVTTQDSRSGAPAPRAREESEKAAGADGVQQAPRESYPGTGWGERTHDPVRLVDFHPQPHPAERITVRYEYAAALRALGILPGHRAGDRLRERERGEGGFARPPRW